MYYFPLVLCFLCSLLITPIICRFAIKVGAVDSPDSRKIHIKLMPRLGGGAIFISYIIGIILYQPYNPFFFYIFLGSILIIVSGFLDDIFRLSAGIKLLIQLIAAMIVVMMGGLQIEFINLPLGGHFYLGIFGVPLTIIWIVGITNAINLIDGLDGLAAGVSCIALITITGMAIKMGDLFVVTIGLILIMGIVGFVFYNFYPAKIFLGDTGALFLGYMISVLSLLGFKNVTFISFIIPVIILGVPISDTLFAIIRRIVNKKPISAPDKSHLHHCLIHAGFSHRQTVLIIYAMSALFAIIAVIFSKMTLWGCFLIILILLFMIEIFAEFIGLAGKNYRPILKLIESIRYTIEKRYSP